MSSASSADEAYDRRVHFARHVRALGDVEPLVALSELDRAELEAALADARGFDDLPGKWQAAVLEAELRAAGEAPGHHCH